VDVSLLIRQRLSELHLDQKDLAVAAQVTESYISQLLTRKKAPPASGRTDIYEKIGQFLNLPGGELSRLADVQRRQGLQKKVAEPPQPLFSECRQLILRKCEPDMQAEVRRIFEKDPFGELERLVTQKVLGLAQGAVREDLRSDERLRSMAELSGRSFEQMRVAILEFLDEDIFHISAEGCVSFLHPIVESWSIDLKTFSLSVVLNPRLPSGGRKQFDFMQRQDAPSLEAGFEQFLKDKSLSGDASGDEVEILKMMNFRGRRPSPLYYYRELQSLRDPLHFPSNQKVEIEIDGVPVASCHKENI